MNTKELIILFLILLMFSGCSNKQKDKIDAVPVISVDPTNIKPIIDLKDIVKNISFTKLETNSDCLISGVSKVEICNDRVYVYDSGFPGRLFCFDLHGKFLFKVGSVGQGPGEYVSLLDFTIDIENKCLWLGDTANKILKYDLDGNFIEQYSTDFSIKNLCIIDAKENLMAIRLGYYKDNNYSFINYSLNENKILYQKESNIFNITRSTSGRSFFRSGEKIIYIEPFNDTIYTVRKENIEPCYVIDFENFKLPQELFEDPNLRNITTQLKSPDNNYAGLVTTPNEISNFLFFIYNFSDKRQTAIYSIKSDKLISINEISFIGKTFEFSKCSIHTNQGDNQFICFLPAHLLTEENIITKGQEQLGYGNYSDINELLTNLNADDNPIMVIGELNIDNLF